MNKYQLKTELINLNNSLNFIDNQIIKMKTTYNTFDKTGYDVDELLKMIDDMGISFYKLKTESRNFIKEQLKKSE